MSIEMVDKDGVVRDVIIEDYHDEVYCTDVKRFSLHKYSLFTRRATYVCLKSPLILTEL